MSYAALKYAEKVAEKLPKSEKGHRGTRAMDTLKDFQKTMKELENFKKMMDLVRQYPIKPWHPRPRRDEWYKEP